MKKTGKSYVLKFAISAGGVLVLATQMNACTNASTPATSSSVTSMGGAVSKAMATISTSAPHVVTSGTVTSSVASPNLFNKFLASVFPLAKANAVTGLSSIWDPETGGIVHTSDPGFNNGYTGGNLYGCTVSTPDSSTGGTPCTNSSPAYYYFWTGPSGTGNKIPTYISAKDYIGQQLDPNFINSNGASTTLFGRMKSAMEIPCAMGMLFPNIDSDGTPSVTSSGSIALPSDTSSTVYQSATNGGCGLSTSMAGYTLTGVVVTAVTGSSYYTKKIVLNTPGGNTSTIWLGLNLSSGTMNFMSLEDQANASGRDAVDRTILSATGLGGSAVIKFEYGSMGYNGTRNSSPNCYSGSQWSCSWEFHRMFIDNVNDVAYVLSNIGDPGATDGSTSAPANYIQFTGAAKPNELSNCSATSCTQTLALSFASAGSSGANVGTDDYNGCVNAGTRAISADNSLACSNTGTTINSGNTSGAIELSRQFYAGQTSSVPNILTNTNGNTTVSFTNGTDIYTAATSQ